MPYHVGTSDSCPAEKPHAVIKDSDGKVMGCHMTEQDAKDQMAALYANDEPMMDSLQQRAEWDTAYINDLPDSAFACIDDGGTKDESGKTVPRSLRHYPHHNSSGELDMPHLRNAWSRVNQEGTTSCGHSHIQGHMSAEGMMGDEQDSLPASDIEFRTFRIETRVLDGRSPKIDGYAAVFNSPSEEMGFFERFVEKITPGAFDGVLKSDVRALFNHNPDLVLGRTKAGTLRLSSDSKGLHTEITPPDTQWARDLMTSMKRGDIDQMSFGFTVAKGGEHAEDDGVTRVIDRVGRLFDVSVVTFPAYPATSAQARMYIERLSRLRPAVPVPQRGTRPRVTAVTLARLNRRLNMAEDFALHHLRTRKE